MPLHICPTIGHPAPYSIQDQNLISYSRTEELQSLFAKCPAHKPTPLIALTELGEKLGIASLHYKDESYRFDLNAFKSLGGTYAVGMVLLNYLKGKIKLEPDFMTLAEGGYKDLVANITVTCASAGNHGRAIAAGARHFGCRAAIFLPDGTALERENMIKETGAEIIRHSEGYAETLIVAEETAREKGWVVVSDTAWPGYEDIPQTIMQGYTIMIKEVIEQLTELEERLPTHVFIQGGVGGAAAAIAGYLADRYGQDRPVIIVVEPIEANCLFASSQAGEISKTTGSLNTFLGPLNCAWPSSVAWKILKNHADAFVTISDQMAYEAIDLFENSNYCNYKIFPGPAGIAGVAGLIHVMQSESMAAGLGLNNSSHVLLFGTEGKLPIKRVVQNDT